MRKLFLGLIAVFTGLFWAETLLAGEAEKDIRALLEAQADAWNAGNIPAFMEGYWQSDELRFASGGAVTYGWEDTLESYQRRYDTPGKMGKLKFHDLDIRLLSDTYALAFGRWKLKRGKGNGDLGGLFTLVLENREEGWRIVHDHTSSEEMPLAVVSE